MNDKVMIRPGVALVIAVALGALGGVLSTSNVVASSVHDLKFDVGQNERLIIVVLGTAPDETSAIEMANNNSGHLLGSWYVDEAANYMIMGGYSRARPAIHEIPCPSNQSQMTMVVNGVSADLSQACANGEAFAKFRLPAELRYMAGEPQSALSGWLVLSAFRTKGGAQEFFDIAELSTGVEPLVYRVVKGGDRYVGLGQEANPDGSGPLLGPREPSRVEADQTD